MVLIGIVSGNDDERIQNQSPDWFACRGFVFSWPGDFNRYCLHVLALHLFSIVWLSPEKYEGNTFNLMEKNFYRIENRVKFAAEEN